MERNLDIKMDNRMDMEAKVNRYLLLALEAHLNGNQKVAWEEEISLASWQLLFEKASKQHVLPMVYEAVYACQSFKPYAQQPGLFYKNQVLQNVFLQAGKTAEFLRLYGYLAEKGIRPLVVKGIICREIYPAPDHRLSGDEDILIRWEEYQACHELLTAFGMRISGNADDAESAYEVPYVKPGSNLYIEVHKALFPPDSEAYGEFNEIFQGFRERGITEMVQDVPILTMEYSDHILYLISHAFKHFMHSGFGIRQVCDIVMYARAYGDRIDWNRVLVQCRKIHADVFTAALFEIGRRYLGFDSQKAHLSQEWEKIEVDPTDLLEDMLSGGVYGAADKQRAHSSNITLNAVVSSKKSRESGKRASGGYVLKTIFPPRKSMESRYPWLKKYPFLLPAAWISRILKYHAETKKGNPENNAAESIRIGNERVELMRKYKIIK